MVLLLACRHVQVIFLVCLLAKILIRAIAAVDQHFLHFLSRLLPYPLDHRYKLLLVVGLLSQGLSDDQLQRGRDGGLRVIGLHEPGRPLHDARFRIGEVTLRFRLGLPSGGRAWRRCPVAPSSLVSSPSACVPFQHALPVPFTFVIIRG